MKSQASEMRDAYSEKREPVCIRCGHPLDKIVEPDVERIVWTYSRKLKSYKMKAEASGRPYHDCSVCEDGCAAVYRNRGIDWQKRDAR